jgi:hypothetical protein
MGFLKKMFKPKMPTIVMPEQTPIQAPEVTAAPVMPDSDAVEVNRAKTQEIRRRMQRGGRASTIMSQGSGSGGDDYSSGRLG